MYRDVEEHIKSCDTCQRFKDSPGLPPGYLQSIPVSKIFEHVHVDMMGPVKCTNRGNSYMITATDAFSKWAFCKPVHNIKTTEVIKFMEDYILSVHGKPQVIITDKGSQFTSTEWRLWVDKHRITHNLTTPRHPQSNGIDERLNGTLSRIIRNYVDFEQSNWDEQVKWALYAYNTTVHESTGYSPYQIIHGLDPRSPLKNDETGDEITVEKLDRVRSDMRESANNSNKRAQAKQKRIYDSHHSRSELSIGQLVLVREMFISAEFSKKFHPKWDGPFIVIKLIGDANNRKAVTVFDCSNWSKKTVSINDVKPYIERSEESKSKGKKGDTVHDRDTESLSGADYYTSTVGNTNLIELEDPPETHQSRSNEPNNSLSDGIEPLDIIEGNHRELDCQVTSSPARVRISDTPTVHQYPDQSAIEPREQGAIQEIHQESVEPVPESTYKSPYVMEIMIDNSTADPTYQPPNQAPKRTQALSQEPTTKDQPGPRATASAMPKQGSSSTQQSSTLDSPKPQLRYDLRPNARRLATYNCQNNETESEDETKDSENEEESQNLSVIPTGNAALTSDSETEEETLIEI